MYNRKQVERRRQRLYEVVDCLNNGMNTREIAEKLEKEYNIKVDKKKIELKDAIKLLGTTNVQIKLYEGVVGTVKVDVIGE